MKQAITAHTTLRAAPYVSKNPNNDDRNTPMINLRAKYRHQPIALYIQIN